MSSTFHIKQEECNGCAICVELANGLIKLNDKGVACFTTGGTGDTANFGSEDSNYIFNAIDACPQNCIEEIG